MRGPKLLIGFTRKIVITPAESVPYLTLTIMLISNIFYVGTVIHKPDRNGISFERLLWQCTTTALVPHMMQMSLMHF